VDIALLALKLIGLILICGIGPGLLLVGRLRFSPVEKLGATVASSLICIYLASFALFYLNAGSWAYWTVSAIFGLMGIAGWKTARLLIRHHASRAAIVAFAVVLAWEALHMAMVRNYSGGDWQGDWREHFERTIYFCHQLPNRYLFLGHYAVPARPPMLNLIAAFFCRQLGIRFEVYQLVCLFCNASAFLPCALLLRRMAPRGGRRIAILMILFMLNPSIMQNATLTVTKAMAAGLVVLGVSFYLRGKIAPAAISLAAAVLTHYSACPYAMAVGLHYACRVGLGRRSWTEAAAAISTSAAILATWFGWSIHVFGLHRTFHSAMTTGMPADSTWAVVQQVMVNMYRSFVPFPLRLVSLPPSAQRAGLGWLRDEYFLMAQTTLPMMIGLVGGVMAIFLAARLLFSSTAPWIKSTRTFWLFFLPFCYVLGTAVNFGQQIFGSAQLTLQPLALMGITFLAGWLTGVRRALIGLFLAGLVVDYGLGILLEFDRESRVYSILIDDSGRFRYRPDPSLGELGAHEYIEKLRHGLVFWGDHFAAAGPTLEIISAIIAGGAIWLLARLCLTVRINTPGRTAPPLPSLSR